MFPNVRLMLAAMLASVLALICGFGMFATLRVSREPFARLPPVAAPLPLLADNTASRPLAFAAAEQFDRRFQLGEPQRVGEAMNTLARSIERREDAGSADAPLAAASARNTDEAEKTAAVATPRQPAIASAPSPGEQVKSTTPAANDRAAAIAETEQKPAAASGANTAQAAAVAALAPADPALPPEQTKLESEPGPANVATANIATINTAIVNMAIVNMATAEAPHQMDEDVAKKRKRTHVAKLRRVRRLIANADTAFAKQDYAATQLNFRTAQQAWQPQPAPKQHIRVRHVKVAAKKTKDPAAAVGGPFVNPPSP